METPRGGESLVLHCWVRPSVQAFAIETIKTNLKFSLYNASRCKKIPQYQFKHFGIKVSYLLNLKSKCTCTCGTIFKFIKLYMCFFQEMPNKCLMM